MLKINLKRNYQQTDMYNQIFKSRKHMVDFIKLSNLTDKITEYYIS